MCNIPDNKKEKKELSLQELKSVVDEVVSWNNDEKYVSFVGGEALVRKEDTLEMIKYCNKYDLHTTLVSSGVLLDEDTIDRLISYGVDRVAFSIDGANPETHNKIRGEGVYQKAMDSIKKTLDLRGKEGPKIDFNTIIMDPNLEELPEIHEKARKIGVDEIFYQALVPDNTYKNSPNMYENDLWIGEKRISELEEIMEKLMKFKEKYDMVNNSKRYFELVPRYFRDKEEFDPGKCLAGYMGLNIDPYGDISICGFGPNINVKDAPIRDLWKSKEFKETRKKIKNCERPCLMLCYRKARLRDLISQMG